MSILFFICNKISVNNIMDNRVILAIVVASAILLSQSLPPVAAVGLKDRTHVHVIVIFKDKPDSQLIQKYQGGVNYRYKLIPAVAASLPKNAITRLKKNPDIAYIERDYEISITETETLPWGVDRINAEMVWNGADGGTEVIKGRDTGSGINISIIDTGIDYNHPDLAPNYKSGYDFVNDDDDPMDDNGHGTHCAGIIAAAFNRKGIIGVAPEANLYAVKALDSKGKGYVSDVIAGIEWSVNHKMAIISMSMGSTSDSTALREACEKAYKAGVLLVASAGNKGSGKDKDMDTVTYPGRYDSVIAVAAIDKHNRRASFSSTGPEVELAAPGVRIYSTYPEDRYSIKSGTSMACPHVTGTAALVWHAHPEYNNTQLRERLHDTAEDLGPEGKDNEYGYGMVNAGEAVYVKAQDTDTTPPGSISNLEASSVGDTWIRWDWENPQDTDFGYTMLFLNGTWIANTSNTYYYARGLTPNTSYSIGTHTVDVSGNVNETWVNQTVKTKSTTISASISSSSSIPHISNISYKPPSLNSFSSFKPSLSWKKPSFSYPSVDVYRKIRMYNNNNNNYNQRTYFRNDASTSAIKKMNKELFYQYVKDVQEYTDTKRYRLRPEEWNRR